MGETADEITVVKREPVVSSALTTVTTTPSAPDITQGTEFSENIQPALPQADTVISARDEPSPEVATIHAQIEQTRSEMSETIEAIKAKLSPQHLVEEARQATLETASHAVDEGVEFATAKAHEAVDLARNSLKSTIEGIGKASIRFIDLLRDNPLPTVATCIAVLGFFSVRARR